MPLHLTPLDAAGADRDALVAFLTTESFPFHVRARPTADQVVSAIDTGSWGGDGTETLGIDDDENGRIGIVRLDDLADATAMVDLRLGETWRGQGRGAAALTLATDRVFTAHPGVIRFEGQTREDNLAMRRTFERCGWVLEAHYRDGWPVEGGEPMASVAYSVLRRDWEAGAITPVPGSREATRSSEPRSAAALIAAAWAAEEHLLDPAVRRDPDEVARLLDDDFVEIGQSGRRWTRDALIAAVNDDPGGSTAVVTERSARLLGPHTVLLDYSLRFEGRHSRRSSVWRDDPRMQCVFHQGTPVP